MKVKLFGLGLVLLFVFTMTGCNQTPKPEDRLKEFVKLWNDQKFEKMYTNYLTKETKKSVDKKDFVDRYQKLYKDLEITNLSVKTAFKDDKENKDKEKVKLPIQVRMDSLAGPIEFDKKVDLKLESKDDEENWYINWDTSFIFPELKPNDKVSISQTAGKRGEILDRNGNGLAINGIAQTVGIVPENFDETKKQEVANLLDVSSDYIDKQINQSWVQPSYFVPIKTIPDSNKALIEKLRPIPGVSFQEKEVREYPYKESAAHLTGYVGTITAEELEKHKGKGYSNASIIGKRGLEELLEDTLRAQDGYKIFINRENEPITIAETEPKDGKDIQLTIEANLQQLAYKNMKGLAGNYAAVQPKTGETLALVSSPSFDPNEFTLGISQEKYAKLEKDSKKPLLNRFAATFSPGSTIKPIIGAIGLQSGKLDPNKKVDIKGLTWSKGKEWGDASITRVTDPGHPVNLQEALMYSDNIYFAQTALAIGEKDLIAGFKKLGVGEKLSYEYPIRGSQISNSGKLENSKLLADTGYGQGEVLMSMLHLSTLFGGIVNDGTIMKPHLYLDGKSEVMEKSFLTPEQAKVMQTDLRKIVTNGTAKAANDPKLALAGKTGTAELKRTKDEKGQENGLFVSYDQKNPKIVMTLMIEDVANNGGGKNVQNIVKETFLKWDSSSID